MSIKKSQAILKRFIGSQVQRLVYAGLRKRNHVLGHLEIFSELPLSSFLFPLSSFLFPPPSFLLPLSSFCFPLSSFRFPLSPFLLKILTGSRPKKIVSVRKHGFVFRALSVEPNAKLETYKVFQNRLTFLNQRMIV